MKKIITSEKIPILLWLDEVEEGTLLQAKNLANHPYAFDHISLMPDSHQGYGMPIGGVMASAEVIIPNAVGVDIGCGMRAMKTSLHEIDKKRILKILDSIRQVVPLGFKHHQKTQDIINMPKEYGTKQTPIVNREFQSALHQVGTLGGGNHFIELQKGSDGYLWIMIHSGSRNIGLQVAEYYNKLASQLNEKWNSPVPKKWQLAYLPLDTPESKMYIAEMQYCVDFAFANRRLMMLNIINCFEMEFGSSITFDQPIDIAHNYAKMEKHYSKRVMVHRKGATLAGNNTIGIVPGSQGSKSYIVRGKGNTDSFNSCSHGAGRTMGRNEAIRKLNLKEEIKKLDKQGIIHSIKSQKDLDEAASAYKNIEEVMKNQSDLVEILIELSPLAVIKG